MAVRDDILPEELTTSQSVVVEQIVSNILERYSRTEANVPHGERLRQPKPAQDINGFFDLVRRVVEEQQNSEQVPIKNRIKFLQDFPPGDIETEVITFGLIQRRPFSMSQGQHFNQRVREVKPHMRGIEDDPARPGYKVITHGQLFENEIVFTCWAKTNKQANIRARWFEDQMRDWRWYIRYEGVSDYYFIGQDEDIALKLDGTENILMGRPLRFWVKTERLSHVLEPTIRRIVVQYGLGQNSDTE